MQHKFLVFLVAVGLAQGIHAATYTLTINDSNTTEALINSLSAYFTDAQNTTSEAWSTFTSWLTEQEAALAAVNTTAEFEALSSQFQANLANYSAELMSGLSTANSTLSDLFSSFRSSVASDLDTWASIFQSAASQSAAIESEMESAASSAVAAAQNVSSQVAQQISSQISSGISSGVQTAQEFLNLFG